MLRIFAMLIGIAFIGMGVAGFLPQFVFTDLLFGYFQINKLYNVVHITCGIFAIIAAMSVASARFYFQLVGLIFALIAIVGFLHNGDLYIMQVNMAGNLLHIAIAIIALLLGFVFNRDA